jgi:serine/threonine-protein kinase HipA
MEALKVPEPAFREAYRRAAFNAAMSVRDDHAKNFAFVKGRDNRWDISHAYDLTYMPGPGGYHTMTFADGNSVDPTQADLLKLARHYHLDEVEARTIVQTMVDVARQVGPMARGLGVSQNTLVPIDRRLGEIARSVAPTQSRGRGK